MIPPGTDFQAEIVALAGRRFDPVAVEAQDGAESPGAPTLVTLVMYPILVFMYARLAKREEADMLAQLGGAWREYAGRTPRFFPKLRSKPPVSQPRRRTS